MSKQEIYDFVKNCGCCEICCLRYLKARGNEYENVHDSLQKLKVFVDDDAKYPNTVSQKKIKGNTCIACLGFFSAENLDNILKVVVNHPDLKQYECDKTVIALSFPILLNIRQCSLWLALIKEFGTKVSDKTPPEVPLKEAAKLILNPELCRVLNKSYDQSGIMINIYLEHNDDKPDIERLTTLDRIMFPNKGQKKCKEMARGYFEKNYIPTNICLETYEKHLSVPPEIPNASLVLEKVIITGPTVFVAGRYRKLSRELSHTPWVLQGKRIMEDSIQELIVRNISNYFGVPDSKIIFSSSGREDVDVRCLGKGRPFVLEIPDSKRTSLPMEIAANIENEVEKSNKVSIKDLQMVDREELVHIKTGEEQKKKSYRALCVLTKPLTLEVLKALNMPNGFKTEQITPIRVLHRRPLHKRPRTVYSVKAYAVRNNPHVAILDVTTQAGTYIKELVHGEFGRTNPSILSLIGQWIDIIALDVISIDINWPKEISNRIK